MTMSSARGPGCIGRASLCEKVWLGEQRQCIRRRDDDDKEQYRADQRQCNMLGAGHSSRKIGMIYS